jgi:hypothetical protein
VDLRLNTNEIGNYIYLPIIQPIKKSVLFCR